MTVYIVRVYFRGGFCENVRVFTDEEDALYFINSGAAEYFVEKNFNGRWMKFDVEKMEVFNFFNENEFPEDVLWQDEEENCS